MILQTGMKYLFCRTCGQGTWSWPTGIYLPCFGKLINLHRLGEAELSLLRHGALLHDLGIHISKKKLYKHAAYLVMYDQVLDDYPKKRQLLALLVRNHRKDVKLGMKIFPVTVGKCFLN